MIGFDIVLVVNHSGFFFKGYNIKKMGTLQFYISDFQNDPSYPKQKEFLKSYKGYLKWFEKQKLIDLGFRSQ